MGPGEQGGEGPTQTGLSPSSGEGLDGSDRRGEGSATHATRQRFPEGACLSRLPLLPRDAGVGAGLAPGPQPEPARGPTRLRGGWEARSLPGTGRRRPARLGWPAAGGLPRPGAPPSLTQLRAPQASLSPRRAGRRVWSSEFPRDVPTSVRRISQDQQAGKPREGGAGPAVVLGGAVRLRPLAGVSSPLPGERGCKARGGGGRGQGARARFPRCFHVFALWSGTILLPAPANLRGARDRGWGAPSCSWGAPYTDPGPWATGRAGAP